MVFSLYIVFVLEATFATAVEYFLLSQCSTDQTDGAEKNCSNRCFAYTKTFISFVNLLPHDTLATHRTFSRCSHFYPP